MTTTNTTAARKRTAKPKTAAKQTHVGINVLVDADVHRKMRVKALNGQLTLAEAVEQALRAWVR